MTKVKIDPGICGLITTVTAASEDGLTVKIKISSACEAIRNMISELGDTYDSYELCLKRPGDNILYEYAMNNFPLHVSCPTISGIIKAVEVECKLALSKDASITFEK